ncbi:type III polyketide synthase [Limimaricola pyoseonensis]|uniref:(2-(2,4-dihydroxy-6-methylphenyl)-2-oxoethyl)-4-hydroxy-2-pyrone synthase n=1 Tax=Limimaricola pyoseonensis TaxID=521013 RepID=A0A1G7D7S7_9RHOB|nr:3-oxoacyl-[acyl-carrier-protein] synthase III C-terminal domain-containing protein [Limimaricola pyoseonensis]SDE47050.1 (2-(2,4-dihydroxy-6-methylphenyl)-2-oxoethyl)-4-hydroxy-2-pyrone synthase [Limimaricola pyoseonensis]
MSVTLHGLATALPAHELPQDLVRRNAERILGPRYPQFERLAASFAQSGIARRWSVAPFEWFDEPHGWADRNAVYLEGGEKMFRDAATGALDRAGWRADEVDTIVTVSTTGIATPSFEARAAAAMGFRGDVTRVPIFGLGCAGGTAGLGIAADLARARPGSKVLLVVVEACTPSFRADRLQKADIIATVLFGDGAAAACLSCDAEGGSGPVAIGPAHQHMWPDTLRIMGWEVDDEGLGVVFDRAIPGFATEHFAEAVDGALAAAGLRRADIDRFVCHPGGAKVVTAIESALSLAEGTLDAERAVLRDCGNMSAPTALFVLERVLASGATGRMLACALGPGFTAAFVVLDVAA